MLIASQLGLLAVIIAIGVVVLSLYRQIGVLHERTAPVGGLLTESLAVNQLTEMQLQRMDGGAVGLTDLEPGEPLALLFVAPGCPMCESVVADCADKQIPITYVASDFSAPHGGYSMAEDVDANRWLVSMPLALALEVDRTPTVVVLNTERTAVLEKRLVERGRDVSTAIERGFSRARREDADTGEEHAMA